MRIHALISLLLTCIASVSAQSPPVTFATLLRELVDLERLARLPDPAYRTVQFGSSDRRTSTPDAEGWFANADGFGQEPIPAFAAVLREPDADGVGEYLVCDVDGPGAIVRGWSAGMDGVLRVFLDGQDAPLFAGKGYDFFARRTQHLIGDLGWIRDARLREALEPQQDASYLPIPFGKHLRITWKGRVRDLHFYQLQVRRYAPGARVETFRRDHGIAAFDVAIQGDGGAPDAAEFELAANGTWQHDHASPSPSALRSLSFRVAADDLPRALRGVLLRIACDGASVPQVEAPLGDFFATAPGICPYESLPITVAADGTLTARWVMPYRRSLRVELQNHSGVALRGSLQERHAPLATGFDEATLYFHAHWRVDHELHARGGKAPIDLPYVTAIGQGRLVGLACQVVNPPMQPSWRSNWWGEGDERIAVDGAIDTYGTGSEDYFDYSWSHWRYFAHPYCGQPLSSGPGNCGYVCNHRFQIVDDLPFAQSLWATMELWSHRDAEPVSYGRIAYFYARPGALTDHRALQPAELVVPKLPPWGEHDFDSQGDARTWMVGDATSRKPDAWTRSGSVLMMDLRQGVIHALPFEVAKGGDYRLRLACQQRPDAPIITVSCDQRRLAIGGSAVHDLRCVHGERFEDLVFDGVSLTAGAHTLEFLLAAGERGALGIDLLGYELQPPKPKPLDGASEAELWDVVDQSDGVVVELQSLGAGWSSGHQRFVKCTAVGDRVTFRVPATGAAKAHCTLRLTTSWDYGMVQVDWNGERALEAVDLWCGAQDRRVGVRELDLGERDLSQPVELRFTVTGHAAGNEAPHVYFGVDCLVAR
ncbi:MAG: glycoside hydrolase family 172 protein [Planctomycetota bacterium]